MISGFAWSSRIGILSCLILGACVSEFTQLRHRETQLLMDGIPVADERLDPFRVAQHVVGVFSVPLSGDVELAVGVYGGRELPLVTIQSPRLMVGETAFELPENHQGLTSAPSESMPLLGYINLGVVEDEALQLIKSGSSASLVLLVGVGDELRELEFILEPYTYHVLPSG